MHKLLTIAIMIVLILPLGAHGLAQQDDTGPAASMGQTDTLESAPAGDGSGAGASAGDAVSQMTDIHDIKALEDVAARPIWILWLLGALVAVGLLAWLIRYLLKRREQGAVPTLVPQLPPEETALGLLNELSDVRLVEGRVFYFQLLAILRRYVFERFGLGAPEMTTEEFLPEIKRIDLAEDLAVRLRELCRFSDPIKFAGRSATEKAMQAHLDFAREFVTRTTPPPDAESAR